MPRPSPSSFAIRVKAIRVKAIRVKAIRVKAIRVKVDQQIISKSGTNVA